MNKIIHAFSVSNDNSSLKVCENTPVLLVTHVSDLKKHFDIKGLIRDAEDEFFKLFGCVHQLCLFHFILVFLFYTKIL